MHWPEALSHSQTDTLYSERLVLAYLAVPIRIGSYSRSSRVRYTRLGTTYEAVVSKLLLTQALGLHNRMISRYGIHSVLDLSMDRTGSRSRELIARVGRHPPRDLLSRGCLASRLVP
jgi:hypothetical protein